MEKLLKQKNLTALDKLFILQIMEYESMSFLVSVTTQDYANMLGVSRKSILDVIAKLEEMDYITTKVSAPNRYTTITQRLNNLIND